MIGIRRLAEHLQISIGTVSRALNGRPDVNEHTRARVLEAAARLGYAPSHSGRALRRGRTGVVGFLMRTGGQDVPAEKNLFFMGLLDGIQSVLSTHQLDLLALLYPADGDPEAFLRRVVARGITDALMLSATRRDDPRIAILQASGLPFVTLGRSAPHNDYLWFDADVDRMGHDAAERLWAKGHRRVAILTSDEGDYLFENFSVEFLNRFAQLGGQPDQCISLRDRPNEQGGYDLAHRMLAGPKAPTAAIILTEVLTLGVYRALQERGLRPGRDIALIGRDSPQSRFFSPALTRFSWPSRDVGVELAYGLLATMDGFADALRERPLQQLWPMTLIEGESDAGSLSDGSANL